MCNLYYEDLMNNVMFYKHLNKESLVNLISSTYSWTCKLIFVTSLSYYPT